MESVFILKNVKIFKNCATLFWQLILAGHSNHETPVASLLRSSRDSLVSQAPYCGKDLEKFQNFLVLAFFCDSVWWLVHKWKLQSQVYSECFATPFATYSQLDLPNHEKHLNKIFKICGMGFWRLDLVTCSRLILVVKNACFAQKGLYSRQFSKTIQFPLHHVLVHCLVHLSLFQNHNFLS